MILIIPLSIIAFFIITLIVWDRKSPAKRAWEAEQKMVRVNNLKEFRSKEAYYTWRYGPGIKD